MATCLPERPSFTTESERMVWRLVREQLPPDAILLANYRVTDRTKDHEADLVVVLPGAGIAVVEVKGRSARHDGRYWYIDRGGRPTRMDPVGQARAAKYALRAYVEGDPRWAGRERVRWGHLVVLPFSPVPDDFALADCPRWMVIDREQLADIVPLIGSALRQLDVPHPGPDTDDTATLEEILAGRPLPMGDLLGEAAERAEQVERLTEQQAVILGAIQLLSRVEVRGGAGSGKTWLAVEQARRLSRRGLRVALMCYSRGLSAYLVRRCATLRRTERPAYVGTFHGLGQQWGASAGSEDDSDFWERRLPSEMAALAAALPPGQRFDAVVVDEAQDFADSWWTPVLASLREEESGGVFVFTDEGQRVFSRFGQVPIPLVPLLLETNLRNTRPIAESFKPLTPVQMRIGPVDGPPVRFVACTTELALGTADTEVDRLLEDWRPQDVALLTTGPRHPEQSQRQGHGQDWYWESFWDDAQVFYGHVLGFKGLERRAVVLAVNESGDRDRARERLYVGLSRARDQLVVCGDPEHIRRIGGPQVAARLGLPGSR
ncbi:MAG: NERD domain-containing protein [Actinomycetota bacterium]|nr:NERD domain-containing protein [Actinomycetota bacterium]